MAGRGTIVAAGWAALALAVTGLAAAPGRARASSVAAPSSQRFAFDDTTQHFTVRRACTAFIWSDGAAAAATAATAAGRFPRGAGSEPS